MPLNPDSEDQAVEQPTIALFAELGKGRHPSLQLDIIDP